MQFGYLGSMTSDFYVKPPLLVYLMAFTGLLGSHLLMDHHDSQQHAGLHHAVWWPQQEVTSPEKSGVDRGAISYQRLNSWPVASTVLTMVI